MTVTELRQRIAHVAYREALDAYAAALEAYHRVPFDPLVVGHPAAIRLDRIRAAVMVAANDGVVRARQRLLALSVAHPDTFRRSARQL